MEKDDWLNNLRMTKQVMENTKAQKIQKLDTREVLQKRFVTYKNMKTLIQKLQDENLIP